MLHALRYWRTRPGSAAAVTITVALGIGAATATFGLVNAVLLRPLPVRDQNRLVVLRAENRAQRDPHLGLSNGVLWSFASSSRALSDIAGVHLASPNPFAVRDGDHLFWLGLTPVTARFFEVLGAAPALGRLFGPADSLSGEPPGAVVGYAAWQREFGGDPGVIGRKVLLLGVPYTILGVTPPDFDYPRGTEVWVDDAQLGRQFGHTPSPDDGWWDFVGRLSDGATLDQARAEFGALLRNSPSPRLGDPAGRVAAAQSFSDAVLGKLAPGLMVVSAAVALVLLIACSNAGGLLLTRGLARAGEMGMRTALGASRRRIVAQLLTEHAVLGIVGGLLGLALGAGALKVVLALAPPELPRIHEAHLDFPTLAFAAAITMGSVVLFGLWPALAATRGDLVQAIRGTNPATGGRRAGLARPVIVAGQVALALVVLAGGGLLGKSLARLEHLDLGFEPDRLLFVGLELVEPLASRDSATMAKLQARYLTMRDALEQGLVRSPGITAATTTVALPFSGVSMPISYTLEGQATSDAARNPAAVTDWGLDDYFGTLGTPIVRGRGFTSADRTGALPVAVVSEGFARQAWPVEEPVGKRLRVGGTWRTVVGVAADTRYWDGTSVRPTIYLPLRQFGETAWWAIRTSGNPRAALTAVKQVLHDADAGWAIRQAATGRELAAGPRARPRFLAATLGILSLIAVALAAVGLFAVLAVSLRQRSRELAVRTALGATPQDIRALVLAHASYVVGAGLAVGLLLVVLTSRALRAVLFEVSPTDPVTLVFVTMLLLVVALIASYVPTRRATRVDPAVVLRYE